MLDQYRRSFAEAHNQVISVIRDELKLEPTGRLAKSTSSIREKLRRESIRLSQIQDIAGCRIVVEHLGAQDELVAGMKKIFTNSSIIDRREKPSHGYRAVHVVVRVLDKQVEVQVRTLPQHKWAEISEKASDLLGPGIQYGRGPKALIEPMLNLSKDIADLETIVEDLEAQVSEAVNMGMSEIEGTPIQVVENAIEESGRAMLSDCDKIIASLEKTKSRKG